MASVAVLGAGAWGTALSLLLAQGGQSVVLWTWQEAHAAEMLRDRENRQFLPGFSLPASVHAKSSLGEALGEATLVVLVLPSHAFRETLVLARPFLRRDATLVSATKGIETDTLMLMSEVLVDVLGEDARERCTFLSGPSFAAEVAQELPTNVVVAGVDPDLTELVQRRFATPRFRVYSSDDPVGVEVGGALKNVIAIAAGACDGLGFGHNTRAALITRGLAEMARLAVVKGANPLTLAGLSGMGDLVLTCTGDSSRNRTVGVELGRGRRLDDVLAGLGHVAEGVRTAQSAHQLALSLGVELPIISEVYRVLYEGKAPAEAVSDVLGRPLKREWEPQ